MSRETNHAPSGRDSQDWRNRPLRFATAETAMRLVGAPKGWRGDWHCPCHPDEKPSFSAKPGREPGVTIVACGAGCSQDELLAHYRKLGYRLGPMKATGRPPPVKRPVTVTTSVAFRALTRSEQAMFHLIEGGDSPTYLDFIEAGISRSAISVGIRALQALGLIGVRRSPRRKGCQQYEPNAYWVEGKWLWWERSKATVGKAIIGRARAVARAARKGGVDISCPADEDLTEAAEGPVWVENEEVEKTETGKRRSRATFVQDQALGVEAQKTDLRFSEVRVRGSDSGTKSYVVRTLGSQDVARPTDGSREASYGGGARPMTPPPSPPLPASFAPSEPWRPWRPPCGGLACGKAGECLNPSRCRS